MEHKLCHGLHLLKDEIIFFTNPTLESIAQAHKKLLPRLP